MSVSVVREVRLKICKYISIHGYIKNYKVHMFLYLNSRQMIIKSLLNCNVAFTLIFIEYNCVNIK